ncbi:PRC-barrel domain-containing protein [Streptomyces sp. NPDC019890]|uniref:PRC-barrel domain-containing protein n=1 Tax=Streptomyces sp. NPDC019890 TaxID=3365064 RepID=UPI00384E5E6D
MQTDIDPRSLIGRKAFDRNGTKIGTVDEVYLDDATGVPEWAAVRTGLFSRDAFVPLEPSKVVDDTLHVPYERSLIKDAPDFGVGRHLSPEQELQLYHHYGLELSAPPETPAPSSGPAPPSGPPPSSGDTSFGRVAGRED